MHVSFSKYNVGDIIFADTFDDVNSHVISTAVAIGP